MPDAYTDAQNVLCRCGCMRRFRPNRTNHWFIDSSHRLRHFHKRRACYSQYRSAVKSQKLIPQNCAVCDCDSTSGHHEWYTRPLDVVWLCVRHHSHRHRRSVERCLDCPERISEWIEWMRKNKNHGDSTKRLIPLTQQIGTTPLPPAFCAECGGPLPEYRKSRRRYCNARCRVGRENRFIRAAVKEKREREKNHAESAKIV